MIDPRLMLVGAVALWLFLVIVLDAPNAEHHDD